MSPVSYEGSGAHLVDVRPPHAEVGHPGELAQPRRGAAHDPGLAHAGGDTTLV